MYVSCDSHFLFLYSSAHAGREHAYVYTSEFLFQDYRIHQLCVNAVHDTSHYNIMDGTCMTDAEFGILSGLGFSLTFCFVGLIAGRLVDYFRSHTSLILALACMVW
jgi:hypothetical protein